MKKLLKILGGLIAIIVIGIIALAIFSPSQEPTKVSSTSQTKTTTTDTKQKAEQPKVFNVGDTVSYNGLNVTITKAEYTAPEEYGEPKNGKVLTLSVDAKNVSKEKLMVDNTEFNLYDANGNKIEQYYGYNDVAISGTIDGGRALQGKIFYDVPAAPSYELIYTPSFSANADGSKQIKYNIKM